jgi:hypothetical protein
MLAVQAELQRAGMRLRSRPSTRPMSSAQIMGSSTTLPTPSAMGSGPSHSDKAAITSASAKICTTLPTFIAALAGCISVLINVFLCAAAHVVPRNGWPEMGTAGPSPCPYGR